MNSDAWVTIVCKKIEKWWRWVAEGDTPLVADHGKEIIRYKELDPAIRLMILKALCEIRSQKCDISRYINDELKRGTELSTFRKDKMVGDGHGITFWYDGDPVLGHRLYRESGYTGFNQLLEESSHVVQQKYDFKWETLATNLEEFRDILDKLSSSTIPFETAVSKTITNEIIPVLLKKEKALKKRQRHAKELHDSIIHYQIHDACKFRTRRTVCYTFDEFDRTIEEAININNEVKNAEDQNNEGEQSKHAVDVKGTASAGAMVRVDNNDRVHDDEKKDEEVNDCSSNIQNDGGLCNLNRGNDNFSQRMPLRDSEKEKGRQLQKVMGLRRSIRTASRCRTAMLDSDMKKRPLQQYNHDRDYENAIIVPDSEDDNS